MCEKKLCMFELPYLPRRDNLTFRVVRDFHSVRRFTVIAFALSGKSLKAIVAPYLESFRWQLSSKSVGQFSSEKPSLVTSCHNRRGLCKTEILTEKWNQDCAGSKPLTNSVDRSNIHVHLTWKFTLKFANHVLCAAINGLADENHASENGMFIFHDETS